jgi:hemerythrin-like domain-containing protein
MADVTEILSRQHREVESLFEQFDAAASDDQRGALARAIVENLSEHAALEEMTVYPEIEHDVGDDAADALRDEHQQLKEVLAVIDSLAPGDPEFIGHMHEARHLVQQHVDEEENAVFPRFRQSVSQEKLDSLGDKVESQWSSAPTHPHPNAPNTPPVNKITGPAVGLFDKARDAMGGD